jgi:hypothetical protein
MADTIKPAVEAEGEVYRYVPPENGTNPMWCRGNTSIVRWGDRVFASGYETIPGAPGYNNVRWLLFERTGNGWTLLHKDEQNRTREPCPMGIFPDGSLFLSDNPAVASIEEENSQAEPRIVAFSAQTPEHPGSVIVPRWSGSRQFTQHSYRSFSLDAGSREIVLFHNYRKDKGVAWTFCDSNGEWCSSGELIWPWGAGYEKPQPIRICYPAVQLKNRAAYFFGVSDIVEPNSAWKAEKFAITGREWDYDMRRAFFTWTPDITTTEFRPWIEIAGREDTCGWITICDLWRDPRGRVHLLWNERAIDERLRERFFPEAKQSIALCYAIVESGTVTVRREVEVWNEGEDAAIPREGRFHITPDQRLFILYYVDHRDAGEQRLVEVLDAGEWTDPASVEVEQPLATFFTAGPRSGCASSNVIDVFGRHANTMRYFRLRLP